MTRVIDNAATLNTRCAERARQALSTMPRDSEDDIATFALTLHMLQHHAPHFFSTRGLDDTLRDALTALDAVDTTFPQGLQWQQAQARLDALYVRHLRGMTLPTFDVDGLQTTIAHMATLSPVGGWLLAQLALPLGVVVEVVDAVDDDVLEFYRATHVVLLSGQYFQRPAVVSSSVVATIEAGGAFAFDRSRWDLLAECAFCLQTLEHPYESGWLSALRAVQKPAGVVVEHDAPEQAFHCTAAALLAFAGAADRSRVTR
jgi:D-amino peptidase